MAACFISIQCESTCGIMGIKVGPAGEMKEMNIINKKIRLQYFRTSYFESDYCRTNNPREYIISTF